MQGSPRQTSVFWLEALLFDQTFRSAAVTQQSISSIHTIVSTRKQHHSIRTQYDTCKVQAGPHVQRLYISVPFHMSVPPSTVQVPPDVKTGEDAVRIFSSSAARDGLLIYLNLTHMSPHPSYPSGTTPVAPPSLSKRPISTKPYNPYDLRVVLKSRADPEHHFIMSQTGTTQMR